VRVKPQGPRGGFTWRDLVDCYARGVFPMADTREDDRVFLVDPEERGVFPLDRFHVPRRLARTIRSDAFQVRVDTAFPEVLAACAKPSAGREDTWINSPIKRLYRELFAHGLAHSVECWSDGELVGGLYGVALGAAFFGESMFSNSRDASKVALAHLVARLRTGRYLLLDAQFLTGHLAQFGAEAVPRAEYQRRLATALEREGDFYRFPPSASGAQVLEAISPVG
jgi:leucyl/phenylalanyl-tRNA--protein transferase